MADRYPDYVGDNGNAILQEADPGPGKKARRVQVQMTKAPVVVAGYGGWSRVARPRRKALTEWVGRDSVSIQIEFMIDSLDEREHADWVEDKCRLLESFAGVESNDPEPPLLELHSYPDLLMPHGNARASHVKWFLETLAWSADSVIYADGGNRLRAAGTMTVTQYVADDRIGPAKKRKTDGNSEGGRIKRYKIKKGDTLQKIAAKKEVYNDRKKWRRIKKANHIRDPKLGPKWVGKTIKIP